MEPTSTPIVVLGMHRSGTSALTGMLHSLGIHLGPEEDLKSPQKDNPQGFWENNTLVEFNDRLLNRANSSWFSPPHDANRSWEIEDFVEAKKEASILLQKISCEETTWAWKDPRTCLTLPFWRQVFQVPPVVILVHRHPVEVAQSLQVRDQFPLEVGLGLWEIYNRAALRNCEGLRVLVVRFESLIDSPLSVARKLFHFLQEQAVITGSFEQRKREIESSIDPDLRHHIFCREIPDGNLSVAQKNLWECLCSLEERHTSFKAVPVPSVTPLVSTLLEVFDPIGTSLQGIKDEKKRTDQMVTERDQARLEKTQLEEQRDLQFQDLERLKDKQSHLLQEREALSAEVEMWRQYADYLHMDRSTLESERDYYCQRRFQVLDRMYKRLRTWPWCYRFVASVLKVLTRQKPLAK
ncbi:MAG: sulfotransferase [Planctomycetes bacterium]|nr:sulfotransferase [Planctomycetota bacterium]